MVGLEVELEVSVRLESAQGFVSLQLRQSAAQFYSRYFDRTRRRHNRLQFFRAVRWGPRPPSRPWTTTALR